MNRKKYYEKDWYPLAPLSLTFVKRIFDTTTKVDKQRKNSIKVTEERRTEVLSLLRAMQSFFAQLYFFNYTEKNCCAVGQIKNGGLSIPCR